MLVNTVVPGSRDKEGDGLENEMLDALVRARYHGSVVIRGIRYQVLYSVLQAIELLSDSPEYDRIQLEGLEDIDLLGEKRRYVQVKTATQPFRWSNLQPIISNFLKVLRVDEQCSFGLHFDGPPEEVIQSLKEFESLPERRQAALRRRFAALCNKAGATGQEVDALLLRTKYSWQREGELLEEMRQRLAEHFQLGGGAASVEVYVRALIARHMDWAKERRVIRGDDLRAIQDEVGQALVRESEYQAYGRGLIDQVSWTPDGNKSDFYSGKATRPGHIVAELDVVRSRWLDLIEQAMTSTQICIVRSSSGQGKSALALRYAYDRWPREHTYRLRAAGNSEQAASVILFLQHRRSLGLPTFLLIDVERQTRSWTQVAQECAAMSVPVLATIRTEDWHRTATNHLFGYEILEPHLSLSEAKEIHHGLSGAQRLHSDAASAEAAYERIGEPRLLMEYVYLLTHGEMLEERLRQQVREFTELAEDPAKVQILRRAAVASRVGVSLSLDSVVQDLNVRDDVQQVLESLEGEYVQISNGRLGGLHWVRSDHLASILHASHPSITATYLEVLDAADSADRAEVVAKMFVDDAVDREVAMSGLLARSTPGGIATALEFLDGIFEAGETRFFNEHANVFDEVVDLVGPKAAVLFACGHLPVHSVDIVSALAGLGGAEAVANLRRMQELSARITPAPRGLDECREFLDLYVPTVSVVRLGEWDTEVGRLLNWCGLCGVSPPVWDLSLSNGEPVGPSLEVPLEQLAVTLQGLHRCDPAVYESWLRRARTPLAKRVVHDTESTALWLMDDRARIEFLVDAETEEPHKQALGRLDLLRAVFPGVQRYQSQGIWPLPPGIDPPFDDTQKDIAAENLPRPFDVQKNKVFRRAVETRYIPDSFYEYEQIWNSIRRDSIVLARWIIALVRQRYESGNVTVPEFDDETASRLLRSIQMMPSPPSQMPGESKKDFSPGGRAIKWLDAWTNAVRQILAYSSNADELAGHLIVHNARDAYSHLITMHAAFQSLYGTAPDYFDLTAICREELEIYDRLYHVLVTWIQNPPRVRQRNLMAYARKQQQERVHAMRERFSEVLQRIENSGVSLVRVPDRFDDVEPTGIVPFEVTDTLNYEAQVERFVTELVEMRDVVQWYWLVPLINGRRFLGSIGLRISSVGLEAIANNTDAAWSILPLEMPTDIARSVEKLPEIREPKHQLVQAVSGIHTSAYILVEFCERLSRPVGDPEIHPDPEGYQRKKWKLRFGSEISKGAETAQRELLQMFKAADREGAVGELVNRLDWLCDHASECELDELWSTAETVAELLDSILGYGTADGMHPSL